jgi:hypothetical protein
LQKVKDLHVVFSSDFDTEAISVSFVELLDDSLVVVIGKSSVLHDLNLGFATDVSGTSLSSVVHDGDLEVAAVLISHGYGWVNGVVVGGDVLELFVDLEIVVVVKLSLLHGKSIRVCPKLALWVESIEKLPVDCNVFTSAISSKRNGVHLNLELNHFLEELWWKSHSDNSLLLSALVVENEGVLVKVGSLLIKDVGVQLRVRVVIMCIVWSFPLRSEGVGALITLSLHLLNGSEFIIWNILPSLWVLKKWLCVRLVITEIDSKCLRYVLSFVFIVENDRSIFWESLDFEGCALIVGILGFRNVLGVKVMKVLVSVDLDEFDKGDLIRF